MLNTTATSYALPKTSFRRYVHYMQELIEAGGFFSPRICLSDLRVHTCPKLGAGGCLLLLTIENNGAQVYSSVGGAMQPAKEGQSEEVQAIGNQDAEGIVHMRPEDDFVTFPRIDCKLSGDVRVTLFYRDASKESESLLCYFWFHTGFIEGSETVMEKQAIDMAWSDSSCVTFDEKFAVTLSWDDNGREIDPAKEESSLSGKLLGEFLSGEGESNTYSEEERDVLTPGAAQLTRKSSMRNRLPYSFRKVHGPGLRVRECAKRFRGAGDDQVEAIDRHVRLDHSRTNKPSDSSFQHLGPDPVQDNLICHDGDLVSHREVRLYAYQGGAVHAHKHSKRLGSTVGGANLLVSKARKLVSGKKKRFIEDGFDLDLTYITPKIIAMGFPSKGVEGQYRNNEEDVYRFFQSRHAGHYRVINLCSERQYNLEIFHGNCARYPFPDHNPPGDISFDFVSLIFGDHRLDLTFAHAYPGPTLHTILCDLTLLIPCPAAMDLILPCMAHIHAWLQSDADNVVAVHCKAGKGRTGLVIICYMLYCGLTADTLKSRSFYDWQRTDDGKGLTIISQIRYAHYFGEQLRRMKYGGLPYNVSESESPAFTLRRIDLLAIPHFERDGGCNPFVNVYIKSEEDSECFSVYDSTERCGKAEHIKPSQKRWSHTIPKDGQRIWGDVRFVVSNADSFFAPKSMFSMWIHTQFVTKPPPEMCGKSRLLSQEECEGQNLPEGRPPPWAPNAPGNKTHTATHSNSPKSLNLSHVSRKYCALHTKFWTPAPLPWISPRRYPKLTRKLGT